MQYDNYIYSSTASNRLVLFPAISEGLNKTCTNISILYLFNDYEISPTRSDLIMLETYKTFDDRIIFSPGTNATLTIEDDGMLEIYTVDIHALILS